MTTQIKGKETSLQMEMINGEWVIKSIGETKEITSTLTIG